MGTMETPSRAGSAETSAQAQALVNWELAASTAARLTPAGPTLGAKEIGAAVENLRLMADLSVPHVHDITGLEAARDLRDSSVLVVDRASWAKANTQSFAVMLQPAIEKMLEGRRGTISPGSASVGGAITGSQLGAILAFLSSKVLGQYDPFSALAPGSTAPAAGRLLLVAPNIISVERELNVAPEDFRLWVCLHEETHRVQFTANPWLRDHVFSEVEALAATMDAQTLLSDGLSRIGEAIKGNGNLLEAISSPEQRAIMDRVTGMMSLLEGHADVVMDGVGPSVIPTVATIREAFNKRRKGTGSLDRIVRRLLGLEQKMAQYRDGAVFVRAVIDRVGMEQFNTVWSGPETLPSKDEIYAPDAWIKRVL